MPLEKAELEGYKKLHGACKGFSPTAVHSPVHAVLAMDCERGRLEMDVTLGANSLISVFAGTLAWSAVVNPGRVGPGRGRPWSALRPRP